MARVHLYGLARPPASRSWLLAIVLLGFAFQSYGLGVRTFHGDELTSLGEARNLGQNLNGILFFAILRGWMALGSGEFWLRVPSALLAVASTPVVFRLVRALTNRTAGIVAAVLIATAPFAVEYGQLVRFYSLFLFSSSLSYLLFILYVQRPSRVGLVLLACADAMVLASHFFGLLVIASQALAAFIPTQRLTIRIKLILLGITAAATGIMIASLPLRQIVYGWVSRLTNPYGDPSYSVARGFSLTNYAKIPLTFFFFGFGEGVYPLLLLLVLPGLIVLVSAFAIGLVAIGRHYKASLSLIASLLVFPSLLYLVFDPLSPPTLQGAAPRYLIFLLPLFYLVLAAGTQGRLSSFLIIPLLLVNAGGLASYWFGDWSYSDDLINWRSVSQWMSNYVTPHTLVLMDGRSQEQASYYFPDSWNIENDWQYRSTEIVPSAGEFARLIVVTYDFRKDMRTSASELLARVETGYNRVAAWSKYPLFIYVYDRKPPDAPGYSFEPSTGSVTIPVEIYGLEFQDVLLPVETVIGGQPVQYGGAFALPGPREEQAETITLQRPVSTGHIILLSNLTDAATAGIGEQVATLKVTARDGTVQILPIRFGYETSAWNGGCQPGACVTAYRWLKRFAVLGSERYQESWEEFAASIFSSDLRLNPGVIVRSLELERVGSPGTFYVWGIVLAQ